ncbi:roadblock/LC7 domain-containing protein [Streptomyces lincolnensis]|uniref:roadblock/LC7 domain-containing protein n=1 Tax=Streptomyces lincolnensis TaxID=1915 RepID=UPI001E335C62|nr:roadblock/LC7 domain-containing protein [Streptomyces lincolnensis]MCD7441653.1 roadblock/LC7 domain-containing protein [Streptomyces lincolnensis]
MAAEAEIQEELRRLRARVPQLTGALAAGADGLVLARDTPGVAPEAVAERTAEAQALATGLADAAGRGEVRELLVRGVHGYVAAYPAGRAALLTLLAEDGVSVGRLRLEGRRAAARIGELLDTAEPTPTPTPTPTATPAAQTPAPKPATKRAPRTAKPKPAATPRTANPRTATPETPAAPTAARTTES